MRKNDLWLIAAFLAVAAAGFLAAGRGSAGNAVRVTVDGTEYGTYALAEDQTIEIGGTNVLVIRDGRADMTEARCPDHTCVRMPAISRVGETIICLPNHIVVEVTGDEDPAIDTLAE